MFTVSPTIIIIVVVIMIIIAVDIGIQLMVVVVILMILIFNCIISGISTTVITLIIIIAVPVIFQHHSIGLPAISPVAFCGFTVRFREDSGEQQ